MTEARIKISPWIKDTMQSIPLRGAFVFSILPYSTIQYPGYNNIDVLLQILWNQSKG